MRKPLILRVLPYLLVVALSLPLLGLANYLGRQSDLQAELFNEGLRLQADGQGEQAFQLFAQSVGAFQQSQRTTPITHLFMPAADVELAALAYGHMGDLLDVAAHQPAQAIEAYQEALRLFSGVEAVRGVSRIDNPEIADRLCTTMPGAPTKGDLRPMMEGSDEVCRFVRMQREALNWKFNLEQLKFSRPEQEDNKGSSKKKSKTEPTEKKQLPSEQPGGANDSHLNPDAI